MESKLYFDCDIMKNFEFDIGKEKLSKFITDLIVSLTPKSLLL